MGAVVCPYCRSYTSPATGYCGVCRRPLQGGGGYAPAAPYAPQPAYAAQPGYGAPLGYGAPAGYAAPYGYGAPMPYMQPAYAPVYMVPVSFDEPAVRLAKMTADARWGGGAIDLLIVFSVWLMLALIVYPALFGFAGFFFPARLLITALWVYLYYAILDGFAGGTVGKRAIGLVLVDRQLRPIRPGQAFGRSFEIFIWPLGFIIILLIQTVIIEKGGQSIGDKLGATYLVRRKYLPTPPAA